MTKYEKDKIEKHPENGADIVKEIPGIGIEVSEAILYHHKYLNGQGYPKLLKPHDIPKIAKVLTIACEFDRELAKCIYSEIDSYEKAIEIIKEAKKNKRLDGGLVDTLEKVYRKCLNTEIESESYKFTQQAIVHIKSNRYAEAEDCFNKAIGKDDCNVELYMGAGKMLEEAGLFEKAIDYYSKALRICPTLVEAYYRRANAYRKNEDWDNAGIDYGIAVTICPSYIEAHIGIGIIRQKLHKYDKALTKYQKIIEMDDKNAFACYEIGKCHFQVWCDNIRENPLAISYSLLMLEKALELYGREIESRDNADRLFTEFYGHIENESNLPKAIISNINIIRMDMTFKEKNK